MEIISTPHVLLKAHVCNTLHQKLVLEIDLPGRTLKVSSPVHNPNANYVSISGILRVNNFATATNGAHSDKQSPIKYLSLTLKIIDSEFLIHPEFSRNRQGYG